MNNPLLVGVDVHRKTNTVCTMDRQGQELGPRLTVDNNLPGTQALARQLAELMRTSQLEGIRVAAEAVGWYWFHFFQALSQDPQLAQWPLELFAFNPRLTANFKKTYLDLDHTDPIDAFVAADRLRLGRDLPAPFRCDDVYLPLRFLTRYRLHLIHSLTRQKAYCLSILYLKASEYTRHDKKPFSDVFGAASQAVLKEFASLEEIAAIPFEQLVEFVDVKEQCSSYQLRPYELTCVTLGR
jgi:transposase